MSALDLLNNAKSAIKAGRRVEAREYAMQALQLDKSLEEAWLILAALASPEASVAYLQKALQINPDSIRAKNGMRWAVERLVAWESEHPELTRQQGLDENKIAPTSYKDRKTSNRKKPSTLFDADLTESGNLVEKPIREKGVRRITALRTLKYIAIRLVTILFTICIGIFITILIANRNGSLDQVVYNDAKNLAQQASSLGFYEPGYQEELQLLTDEFVDLKGLNLPYLPRHLTWLKNTLLFEWGSSLASEYTGNVMSPETWKKLAYSGFNALTYQTDPQSIQRRQAIVGGSKLKFQVAQIIVTRLPNTLLLVGTANLLVFLLGIPLALFISDRAEKFMDRVVVALAPLSSIPSWVHGIILVMIFAVTFHFLPFGRMYDVFPPATAWGYIPIVLKHMVLPVLAIFLSLFFQCVYAWRTYCLLYSMEDYVDLAKAKGLSARKVARKYILRPSMPYIFTSFALTFISFWQTTTALEYFFDWPGIGQLYIESIKVFDSIIVIAIVTIFAYILGALVFLLDIFYVILDPRIQLHEPELKVRAAIRKFLSFRKDNAVNAIPGQVPKVEPVPILKRMSLWLHDLLATMKYHRKALPRVKSGNLKQVLHYPSAVIGLSILALLIILSIYVLITMPYKTIDYSYETKMEIKKYQPTYALPSWTNYFRKDKKPETIIINTKDDASAKSITTGSNGNEQIELKIHFSYPYSELPQSFRLYFDIQNITVNPYASVSIVTPDGRTIPFKGQAIQDKSDYDFLNLAFSSFVKQHSLGTNIKLGKNQSFASQNAGEYPIFYLVLTDPETAELKALEGTYTLDISITTFEPGVDVDAELVMLGKVHGLAGTDNFGNELITPLLQGAPIAIGIGIIGAVFTSILSLVIAAISAWYGGWLDTIIQRISEATMIIPILAICVLLVALFGMPLWSMILIIIILNAFGSPIKSFRAAFLQVKSSPYIEAAKAYGASDWRIITKYIIPRIMPVLFPQLILLIPTYVFLEATLAIFGVNIYYATWGSMIYNALKIGAWQQSYYWVFEPIIFLLITGLAFALIGSALDRIYNPRLQQKA